MSKAATHGHDSTQHLPLAGDMPGFDRTGTIGRALNRSLVHTLTGIVTGACCTHAALDDVRVLDCSARRRLPEPQLFSNSIPTCRVQSHPSLPCQNDRACNLQPHHHLTRFCLTTNSIHVLGLASEAPPGEACYSSAMLSFLSRVHGFSSPSRLRGQDHDWGLQQRALTKSTRIPRCGIQSHL